MADDDALVARLRACEGCLLATADGVTHERVAEALRKSIKTLRKAADLPTSAVAQVVEEVLALFKLLPRQSPTVGQYSVYPLNNGGEVIRRTFLDKGGYNLVFRAEYTAAAGAEPVYSVLRFMRHFEEEGPRLILMAFVETCIAMMLSDTGAVIPTVCPLKVERSTDPGFDFGSLMPNAVCDGGTMLHTLIGRRYRNGTLTEEWCFGIFLLVLEVIGKLQTECKFMHRDLKSDNIMVQDDPDRTHVEVEGARCPVEPEAVRLIDFGYSEFRLDGGERIGSDPEDYLIANKQRFNDSVDVVYLAYTMLEDDNRVLRKVPRFTEMLNDISERLIAKVRKDCPRYNRLDTNERNEAFLNHIYSVVKHGSWSPALTARRIKDRYHSAAFGTA